MSGVRRGLLVDYTLTTGDAEQINRRRTTGVSIAERIKGALWPIGAQAHIGNVVAAGDTLPMVITRVDPIYNQVNGQVFLDGNDTFWVTSAEYGAGDPLPGHWTWPKRAEVQS